MILLGVDPGTDVVGWGAVQLARHQLRLVECGAIRPGPRRADMAMRLLQMHNELETIAARLKPQAAAVERAFYGKSADSTIKIGMARGAVLVALARAGVPVVDFAPAKIKKAVTGKGSASKGQVAMMVAHLLGLERPPQPADATDALAGAICLAHRALVAR